jgi:hypothetical protein
MRLHTLGLTLGLVLLAAIGVLLFPGHHRSSSSAPTQGRCVAVPHACGFPDATNTGVPAGVTLKTVPGQVSSGPGWRYNAADREVDVTGSGTLLSGLSVSGGINVSASNVTIKDDQVVTGGDFGIGLQHTSGVTVEDSTVRGLNRSAGRVGAGIGDVYGDSTGMVIENDNVSAFRCGVQVSAGTITGNYIHDPGYIAGDHTNGVIANGGAVPLIIYHNTILNNLDQTDAVTINTEHVAGPVMNKTIEDNLLAGGGYPIYGGTAFGHATADIVIENNRFDQAYYPKGGQFGPAAYFDPAGTGNVWSGNTWISSGKTVPAP